MMKIPNIIAPRLLKKQINTDCEKKSFFNKKVIHGPETFAELAKLISKKKLDILNVDKGSHKKTILNSDVVIAKFFCRLHCFVLM